MSRRSAISDWARASPSRRPVPLGGDRQGLRDGLPDDPPRPARACPWSRGRGTGPSRRPRGPTARRRASWQMSANADSSAARQGRPGLVGRLGRAVGRRRRPPEWVEVRPRRARGVPAGLGACGYGRKPVELRPDLREPIEVRPGRGPRRARRAPRRARRRRAGRGRRRSPGGWGRPPSAAARSRAARPQPSASPGPAAPSAGVTSSPGHGPTFSRSHAVTPAPSPGVAASASAASCAGSGPSVASASRPARRARGRCRRTMARAMAGVTSFTGILQMASTGRAAASQVVASRTSAGSKARFSRPVPLGVADNPGPTDHVVAAGVDVPVDPDGSPQATDRPLQARGEGRVQRPAPRTPGRGRPRPGRGG
jgi:hypothetical protein